MRTLDQVIKTLEDCEVRGGFFDWKYGISDALHYLKNYRDTKEWLDLEKRNYAEAVDNCEKAEAKYTKMVLDNNRNDPLSWDELRTMGGKPVWLEMDKPDVIKAWFLICQIDDSFLWVADSKGESHNFPRVCLDTGLWQAYRKER